MILQNFVFSDNICKKRELFFRSASDVVVVNDALHIPVGGQVSFDTYMNIFDFKKWNELTGIKKIELEAECKGEGTIRLIFMDNGKKKELAKENFDFSSDTKVTIKADVKKATGYLCVEAEARREFAIKALRFKTPEEAVNKVNLAGIICTYGRSAETLATVERLKGVAGLSLYVIDNKKEIPETKDEHLWISHNENTGGAGGFTKGLELIRNDFTNGEFSHVIFMDDDAYVNPETIVRTHALLSYLDMEYEDRSISGRMFLNETPWIQHTAAEIWNGGNIKHIGGNTDMTRREELCDINNANGAQYGGFWFSCVPYSFAKENDPLPLFLHCDDVEYGLRQGTEPIILNGIQVWHESPKRRGTHIAAYYDIRNSMIVNSLGFDDLPVEKVARRLFKDWRDRIKAYRANHDCDSENMALLAMRHFLKGPDEIYNADSGRLHEKLLKIKPVETIGKRPIRITVKVPYGKVNEIRSAGVEREAVKRMAYAVSKYRDYKFITK